jgi:hydrogenase maturation protease
MPSVIVCVGNPLLGDDAVGLEAARHLALAGSVEADVKQAVAGGLQLAEMIADYDFALILDAYYGDGICEIEVDRYRETVANHDISFPCAYNMLSKYVGMPKVRVLGIGIDGMKIGEKLSEKARTALPEVVKKAKAIIEEEHELAV